MLCYHEKIVYTLKVCWEHTAFNSKHVHLVRLTTTQCAAELWVTYPFLYYPPIPKLAFTSVATKVHDSKWFLIKTGICIPAKNKQKEGICALYEF